MPKCKHCKGEGYVYPVIQEECSYCFNYPDKKKTCSHCNRTGWEKTTLCVLCCECSGDGKAPK